MVTTPLSTVGIQLISSTNLQAEQSLLLQLNEQLASNKQHDNLTDYSPLNAQQLVNFQNAITQRQAYITSMKTVNARLQIYDNTMTDMENLAAQANQLATQNPTLDTNKVGQIGQEIQSFMKQVVDDLNQQVGSRYIYAGTRYSTAPVSLSAVLNNLSPSASPVASPNLPTYDSEYNSPGTTTDAAAWAQDSVTVDAGFSLQYGVTSVQTGFQQLVSGMQFVNAATQSNNAATYQTDMTQASTLLTTALHTIETYHAGVAAATNTVSQEQTTQNQDIANLQSQIGDIQNVDMASVGTQLNTLQAQLQASYSATANLSTLSILKYL
jgi:flagellar hook-associated protein 3 FlgL